MAKKIHVKSLSSDIEYTLKVSDRVANQPGSPAEFVRRSWPLRNDPQIEKLRKLMFKLDMASSVETPVLERVIEVCKRLAYEWQLDLPFFLFARLRPWFNYRVFYERLLANGITESQFNFCLGYLRENNLIDIVSDPEPKERVIALMQFHNNKMLLGAIFPLCYLLFGKPTRRLVGRVLAVAAGLWAIFVLTSKIIA